MSKLRNIAFSWLGAALLLAAPTHSLADAPQVAADWPAPVRIQSRDPVIVRGGPRGAPLVMRITAPAEGRHLPVAVLSHGNLLNRSDYLPMVEALARDGWIVIQPDHPDASRAGFAPAPYPADTWRIRVEQVNWIAANLPHILSRIPGLERRAWRGRTVVIGHSFGGHTAALAIGARVSGMDNPPLSGRFRAAVLLAPPGNWDGLTRQWQERGPYMKVDWSGIARPTLIVNGTADTTPLTDLGPAWHDDGFRLARDDADLCLMHVEGAGHYLGGIDSVLRPPAGDATPARRSAVFAAVLGFLDAQLDRRSAAASAWPAIRSGLSCKR